jgi:hypothetical protein
LTKTTAAQREIGMLLCEGTHEARDILRPVLTIAPRAWIGARDRA